MRKVGDRTPLLVLVHGTGPQAHDENEVYLEPLNYDAHAEPGVSDAGEQWWQADGAFGRALAERVRTRDGHAISDRGAMYRLKWSGDNKESARDDGADSLAHLFKGAAPRRVHVIAHSHGGNVTRTAIERLAKEKADLSRLGSVVSMGTPFFHYARGPVVARGWAMVAASAGFAVLFVKALELVLSPTGLAAGRLWWVLVAAIPIAGLFTLVLLGSGSYLLRRQPKGVRPPGMAAVQWTNLCSANDEAVQLLRSFDRRIDMFGRSDWDGGWLIWFALLAGLCVMVMTAAFSAADALGWRSEPAQFGASMAGVLTCWLLVWLANRVLRYLTSRGSRLLDGLVTRRLRGLAYGDDGGEGMAGVRTMPWEDAGACVPLPAAVEAAIEAHVARTSGDLWARARRAIRPDASFLDVNFRYLVDEVLTGDELAHTVYYRVDALVDMVAELLVATGDYVRVEAPWVA